MIILKNEKDMKFDNSQRIQSWKKKMLDKKKNSFSSFLLEIYRCKNN